MIINDLKQPSKVKPQQSGAHRFIKNQILAQRFQPEHVNQLSTFYDTPRHPMRAAAARPSFGIDHLAMQAQTAGA
ncbi:hypothetical protein [Pseudogulbenkiania ferrooxidans]|uniref:hypothetical protein n=1 Tax=Pseudogulbenkiania ferrooxidans TaxID=549169 RepID=UPI001268B63C|nr:hypothetical protein [Pseudogulbenkiania ferrooxidans]